MPAPPSRLGRAALLGSLLLAACGGGSSGPPPPPPAPTEITASGDAYQVIPASSYSAGGFDLHVPALGANERLALLVTNTGTSDASITLTAAATSNAVGRLEGPLASARLAAGTGGDADAETGTTRRSREALRLGHELARRRAEAFMAQAAENPGTQVSASLPAVHVARAAAVNDTTSFYVFSYTTRTTTLRPATLRALSDDGAGGSHAQFWVTDDVWPEFQTYALGTRPDLFAALGNAYEQRILPSLNGYFGPESDVDANGQVIFLFADLGQDQGTGGFPVGYFYPPDVYYSAGGSCTAGDTACQKSNHADMLYLLDPVTFARNWGVQPTDPLFAETVLPSIVNEELPGTMAHELQHDVNFNVRCLESRSTCFAAPSPCAADPYRKAENTWINEGLSMVSEDVAGYGLATLNERSRLREYLGCSVPTAAAPSGCSFSDGSTAYGYQAFSMTCWEADAIGNYGGVHAYMRYWLDRMGPGFTKAMLNPAFYGKANVAQATGMSFDAGFARFAAASLVSNEDTSAFPGGTLASAGNALGAAPFSYGAFLGDGAPGPVQPPWAPWHHYTGRCTDPTTGAVTSTPPRTAYVKYTAFDPATPVPSTRIRLDGWGAFVTRGTGADATIQLRTTGASRPGVVLVRYTGALPDASFSGCP